METLADKVERVVLSKQRCYDAPPEQDLNATHEVDQEKMIPHCDYLIDNVGVIHPYSLQLASQPGLCRPYYGATDDELDADTIPYEIRLRKAITEREENEIKADIRKELAATRSPIGEANTVKKVPPPPPTARTKNAGDLELATPQSV